MVAYIDPEFLKNLDAEINFAIERFKSHAKNASKITDEEIKTIKRSLKIHIWKVLSVDGYSELNDPIARLLGNIDKDFVKNNFSYMTIFYFFMKNMIEKGHIYPEKSDIDVVLKNPKISPGIARKDIHNIIANNLKFNLEKFELGFNLQYFQAMMSQS